MTTEEQKKIEEAGSVRNNNNNGSVCVVCGISKKGGMLKSNIRNFNVCNIKHGEIADSVNFGINEDD